VEMHRQVGRDRHGIRNRGGIRDRPGITNSQGNQATRAPRYVGTGRVSQEVSLGVALVGTETDGPGWIGH